MPLFELATFRFEYEGIAALRGLSLAIEQGERLALLGANGSGKSTLLRLLDALCFPSQRRDSFDGQPLTAQRLQDDKFALVPPPGGAGLSESGCAAIQPHGLR